MREHLPDNRKGKTLHFEILTAEPDPAQELTALRELEKRVRERPLEYTRELAEVDRARLASRRVDGYIQTGEYGDGRLGEAFLTVAKQGIDPLFKHWAQLFSLALQHGVPVRELCQKFIGTRFEPSGLVIPAHVVQGEDRKMPTCTSPLDLVCRYLLREYDDTVRLEDQAPDVIRLMEEAKGLP